MSKSCFWTSRDQTVTVKLSKVVAFFLDSEDDWVIEYSCGGKEQWIAIPVEDASLFRETLHNFHTVKEES